jgi:uncharacterized membrane protein YphA (DoxX/SURF4 family)
MTYSRSKLAILALRLVLGVTFGYAAWTKLRVPWALFAISIDAYGLLPQAAVEWVARLLPWVELGLGLLLIVGLLLRWSAAAVSAILLVFFVVMVRAYLLGLGIDCGCFGVGETISVRTLARDGGLLAASIALTVLVWRRPVSTGVLSLG